LAVAEALACGLPIVCYEIPALKEVFGGCKSVFFVSQFNSKVLAEKVLQILESFDAEKLEKLLRDLLKSLIEKNFHERTKISSTVT